MSADELNRRQGHNHLTVFADLVPKRDRFSAPGKDASFWETFAADLLLHNGHPKATQHVALNMLATYARSVSFDFANALLLYDQFYAIQNVGEACNQVLKPESRGDSGKRDRLEPPSWM